MNVLNKRHILAFFFEVLENIKSDSEAITLRLQEGVEGP